MNIEAEKKLKKYVSKFMVDLKIMIYSNSINPKKILFKICLRKNQRQRDPYETFPDFIELTEMFELMFAGEKLVVPDELNKQVVEEL